MCDCCMETIKNNFYQFKPSYWLKYFRGNYDVIYGSGDTFDLCKKCYENIDSEIQPFKRTNDLKIPLCSICNYGRVKHHVVYDDISCLTFCDECKVNKNKLKLIFQFKK